MELALFVMVAMCFDHSKSLLRVTPKYLVSMTSSSTCPVSEYLKSLGSRVCDTRIMLHLAALKCIPQFSSKFRSLCSAFWSSLFLIFL